MNHRQRVLAAVSGDPVDRPPISFWGHSYHRESTAEDLAEATLEFWNQHEWDFIKLNPRASYHAEVWGVQMKYTGVPNEKPTRVDYPVRTIDDWTSIDLRDATAAPLAEQIEAVRRVRKGLPDDVMLIETVFSPLSIAADLTDSPETVLSHLKENEPIVQKAIAAISQTFQTFIKEILRAGADGIFFATVDWASSEIVTPQEYARFVRPSDLSMYQAASGANFNVVHVCRSNNFLAELADYPAHAYSWASTDPTNPDLKQGLELVRGAVAGGVDQAQALLDSSPNTVLSQIQSGFQQTGGRRWIVAPGCSILPATPSAHLEAIREALVEEAQQRT